MCFLPDSSPITYHSKLCYDCNIELLKHTLRNGLKSRTLKVFDPGKRVIVLAGLASPEPSGTLRKPLGVCHDFSDSF
jgi:hypothetical protein